MEGGGTERGVVGEDGPAPVAAEPEGPGGGAEQWGRGGGVQARLGGNRGGPGGGEEGGGGRGGGVWGGGGGGGHWGGDCTAGAEGFCHFIDCAPGRGARTSRSGAATTRLGFRYRRVLC